MPHLKYDNEGPPKTVICFQAEREQQKQKKKKKSIENIKQNIKRNIHWVATLKNEKL